MQVKCSLPNITFVDMWYVLHTIQTVAFAVAHKGVYHYHIAVVVIQLLLFQFSGGHWWSACEINHTACAGVGAEQHLTHLICMC